MATRVDPNETAYREPSHQDLCCLQKKMFWFTGLKGLILIAAILNSRSRRIKMAANQSTDWENRFVCLQSISGQCGSMV